MKATIFSSCSIRLHGSDKNARVIPDVYVVCPTSDVKAQSYMDKKTHPYIIQCFTCPLRRRRNGLGDTVCILLKGAVYKAKVFVQCISRRGITSWTIDGKHGQLNVQYHVYLLSQAHTDINKYCVTCIYTCTIIS